MFFDDFRRAYKARVSARIANTLEALGSGKAGNYDAYIRQVGYIAGLKDAMAEFTEAVKQKVERDDE